MAFATNNRVSIIMLLTLLVLAASSSAFARTVSDDRAVPPIQSEGSGSAKPDDIVDIGVCAIECGARCLHKKSSLGKAFCMAKCLVKCGIENANVKPELYHCALGCAYKSAAETTFSGSDAYGDDNYVDSCYNKCEESYQG